MYYWHALPENWENMDYVEFLEQRRERIANVIRDGYRQLVDVKETALFEEKELAVEEMVRVGENPTVEFKCAIRTNLHTGREDERIVWSWLRTVAGFLNLNGGTLVIGVADNGTAVGLDADRFASEDEMSSHVMELVRSRLGEQHLKHVHPRFEEYQGKRVLAVDCWAADKPVFMRHEGADHFFVRTGATTRELSPTQTDEYIKGRFRP